MTFGTTRSGVILAAAICLSPPLPAFAQGPVEPVVTESASSEGQQQATPLTPEELARRIEVLAAEVDRLRSGPGPQAPLSDGRRRTLGLGESASAVYERQSGFSWAGYGEVVYQRRANRDESGRQLGTEATVDMLRAVLYTGYRFNDRFLFNSEVEFEHGGEEVGVEFAYIEFAVNDHLSVRGGNLLVPLGLVNEFHEPNVFFGTRRPETERRIIPSTWHENGGGVVGSAGPLSFRAYVLNGLNASGFTAQGIRGGRQGGVEALANDWAVTGRADLSPTPGVVAGVGLYRGGSGQQQFDDTNVATTVVEAHGQAQVRGFDVRGLLARTTVDEAATLNQQLGLTGSDAIGQAMTGGYAQFAYNVLSQTTSHVSVSPYYRFERLNTHHEMPTGFVADPAQAQTLHVWGVEMKPISQVVVKADYQWTSNRARTGRNAMSISLGYAF